MTPQIKIKLDPGAEMPKRAHATDVGADIKALHTWLVQGDGTEHPLRTPEDCRAAETRRLDVAKIKIDTGVHATPPPGFYIELVPNSRLAKSPFMFANSLGIIDPDYTGSMRVILNTVNSITPEDIEKFLPGNVVGQLILRRRHEAEFIQVDALEETERGAGGFGSTARKEGKKEPIVRCKDCANARPSAFGGRYCSCRIHVPGVSFPKMGKACEEFERRKEHE